MTDKIYFNHVKWHRTISIGFIGLRGLGTILFPVQIAQLLHNSSTNLGYLSKLQIRQTWYKSLYFIFSTKNIPFSDQNSETLHNAFNVGLASFSFVSGLRLFNTHLLTNRISSLRFWVSSNSVHDNVEIRMLTTGGTRKCISVLHHVTRYMLI
jgi:hypothetical protein